MKFDKNSNIINNSISRYDEMIYPSRPVKFDEFMTDKYNKIHVELFNDALAKYYDDIISKLINSQFMFEFFRLMENIDYDKDNIEESYQIFYNRLYSIEGNYKNNYIKEIIKKLSIDGDLISRTLFDLTNECLDTIKQTIIDNEVLVDNDSLNNIIKDLLSIGDFRIVYLDKATFLESETRDDTIYEPFELYGHEYLSQVISYESDESRYEIIQEKFFMSENDDYIFILETESGIRIAYNIKGEFLLILDSSKYNNYSNFDFPLYIDKKNKGLLNDFKNEVLKLYKTNHKIIEIKDDEYWKPSSILIISNVTPYVKSIVNLDKYWNDIQSMNDFNISDIKLTKELINDAELLYIDYIKGICKMYSKKEDLEFDVPFEYIDKDISVDESYSLNLIK